MTNFSHFLKQDLFFFHPLQCQNDKKRKSAQSKCLDILYDKHLITFPLIGYYSMQTLFVSPYQSFELLFYFFHSYVCCYFELLDVSNDQLLSWTPYQLQRGSLPLLTVARKASCNFTSLHII